MECPVNGVDARHWCARHRRVNPRRGVVLPVAKVATDQRRQPATDTTLFLEKVFDRLVLFGVLFLALNDAMGRLRRTVLPHGLHELRALLAQNSLHTANGVALAVKQVAYAAQQVDVVWPVIAASSAALHRLDFVKTAFPKAQDMLRQVELVRHFTDGAKSVRRLVVQSDLTSGYLSNAVLRDRRCRLRPAQRRHC